MISFLLAATENKLRNFALVFLAGPLFLISVEDEAILALLAIMIPVSWIYILGYTIKVERTEDVKINNWDDFEERMKEVGTKLSEKLSSVTPISVTPEAAATIEAKAGQAQDLFKKATKKAAESVLSPD